MKIVHIKYLSTANTTEETYYRLDGTNEKAYEAYIKDKEEQGAKILETKVYESHGACNEPRNIHSIYIKTSDCVFKHFGKCFYNEKQDCPFLVKENN